ncbi:hypothetical protein B4N89_35465 [Embleya scabrispora]|uniref:DUF6895 domain-containing protein n=1 Tax=Embleya scabrispora TaxID=159449 RepID=A0A1T3NRI2_9ACTN|nr:hypothetical protein [Embleya scabrispora]OPC79345.1 hypothetical protein B4N89_35465 [Embleya scabrispora]
MIPEPQGAEALPSTPARDAASGTGSTPASRAARSAANGAGRPDDAPTPARRRLLQVLTLAEAGLERLDRRGPHRESAARPDAGRGAGGQFVVETARLVLIADRIPHAAPEIRSALHRIATLLAPLARTPERIALLVRHPRTAVPFAITHLAVEQLGASDPHFTATLRRAFATGHVDAVERPPHRRLEAAWLRAQCGGEPVDHTAHRQGSILAAHPHPLHMSLADLHALTHTLFHLTDFGRRELPDEVDPTELRSVLDACLLWHLFEENTDLVAELLTAALLLPGPVSRTALLCRDALDALWTEVGFLPGPGPGRQPKLFGTITGTERETYAFRHDFHTMYAAGLMHAVALGRAPHDVWARPGTPADPGRVGVYSDRWPLWIRLVTRDGPGLPVAPAAEAAIIRAGRDGAYAEMENALLSAPAHGVSPLTVAHARDLLDRHLTSERPDIDARR